jgi:hypothetical protein
MLWLFNSIKIPFFSFLNFEIQFPKGTCLSLCG